MTTYTLIRLCPYAYQQIAYQDAHYMPLAGLVMAIGAWLYFKRKR